jgi:ubiquinone/menaquinone biosynthesis C-methylase UbiE
MKIFNRQKDMPIPENNCREGYNPGDNKTYLDTGLSDYIAIEKNLKNKSYKKILDFGGSTGRVARHFLDSNNVKNITIAEVNNKYVDWINSLNCQRIKSILLKFDPDPIIPLPDNSFDLCYAISVFTHIDEQELK